MVDRSRPKKFVPHLNKYLLTPFTALEERIVSILELVQVNGMYHFTGGYRPLSDYHLTSCQKSPGNFDKHNNHKTFTSMDYNMFTLT